MAAPLETIHDQSISPWGDANPLFPYQVVANGNGDVTEFSGSSKEDALTDDGNLSPFGFHETQENSFSKAFTFPIIGDAPQLRAISEGTAVADGSGRIHADPTSESKDTEAACIWGDVFDANQPAWLETSADPSSRGDPCPTSEGVGTVNPFAQGVGTVNPFAQGVGTVNPFAQGVGTVNPFARDSKFGASFSDNFCEMSETDLIFRSGLVDEEFKTICVTAEEDDLWSSFAVSEEPATPVNQSLTSELWDPFPANREPPNTAPNPETEKAPVRSKENFSDGNNSPTDPSQVTDDQTEIFQDIPNQSVPKTIKDSDSTAVNQSLTSELWDPFPANREPPNTAPNPETEKAPVRSKENFSDGNNSPTDPSQVTDDQTEIFQDIPNQSVPKTIKDSDSTVLLLEGKTSIPSSQFSANWDVQCSTGAHSPSTHDETSQANIGQLLKASTFRQIILDESWTAEMDCLESKAFTVDLNPKPLDQEAEDRPSSMDLLSNQPLPNAGSQGDASSTSDDQNNLWMANNEVISKAPADINANNGANGELQNNILVDFGGDSSASLDVKTVVAPPPEFDNNVDVNSERSNGPIISASIDTDNEPQGNPDKGTDRARTPSDLDRLLNELGDGTMIDEEKEIEGSQLTNGDERVPNDLGGGTVVESKQDDQRQRTASEVDKLLNDLGDGTTVDEDDNQTDRGQTPSDVGEVLVELGDGTTVDKDKETALGQTPSDVLRVLSELGDGTTVDENKETTIGQTPSDVLRVLSELGDGTTVDENKETTIGQTPSDVLRVLSELGDGTTVEEDKETTVGQTPSDVLRVLSELGDGTTVDEDKGTAVGQTPSDVLRVPNELGDGTTVDENIQSDSGQTPSDVPKFLDEDKKIDRGRTLSDLDSFLNELGAGTTVDEEENLPTSCEMRSGDDLTTLEGNSAVPEPMSEEGISTQSTDEAWEEVVRESTIALQESVPEQSSSISNPQPLLITPENIAETVSDVSNNDDKVDIQEGKDADVEPDVSETITKLDLDAKRRSFFGDEDINRPDASFQPSVSDKPSPSMPVASVSLSLALPTVPVLPKMQTAYQRPESFYESKPRAATDSFLSSHALLGLGGDQAISTDTKSRSASEPPPSSISIDAQPATSNDVTSPRSKDPTIAAKSTKFIRALYGPKPGSKSSELVDEDGKTLFEYEQERRDVLSAMKVKRKKKVNWQSEDLTSPESDEPLSPSENNTTEIGLGFSSSHPEESPSGEVTSPPEHKSETEPCQQVEHDVDCSLYTSKEDKSESKPEQPQLAPPEKSPDTPSTSVGDMTNIGRTTSPSIIQDTLTKDGNGDERVHVLPSVQSASPTPELQTMTMGAAPKPQEISASSVAGIEDGSKEEKHAIDLKKMRNLWENKVSEETGSKTENQTLKKNQPRRMFSFDAKAQEVAKKDAVKNEADEKPQDEAVEVDTSDAMPRDLDDDFDRCESYTYEVTPQRKVTIQSHRSTESIIEQEIRQQKQREEELVKQGLLKSEAGPAAVVKEETPMQLVKPDEGIPKKQPGMQSDSGRIQANVKGTGSTPEHSGNQISPCSSQLQIKLKATPVKLTEPEIMQQSAQSQESQPVSLSRVDTSEPVVLIKEKEDERKSDTDAKEDAPKRKESIVQREIRLQRERDEQNALERQRAMEETRTRRASLDSSSRSSPGDSGSSTPVRVPQSPIKLSLTFAPNKPASTPAAAKSFTPLSVSKTADTPTAATKASDKSPVVRFGLGSIKSDPYNSYREYQKMLRGRKTNEKTADKPGPMKATEGSVSVKVQPITVSDSPAKEPAHPRPPSPVIKRPSSPLLQRPPSPAPVRAPSLKAQPEAPSSTAVPDTKPETAVQREIRLARERDAQLQEERAASAAALKKDFEADVTDVIIVEKTKDTERSQDRQLKAQATERPRSVSSPEQAFGGRGQRETPMERDIRLAEEREIMLRKERGLPLKLTPNNTNTPRTGRNKLPQSNHGPSHNPYDSPDSAYCLKTVNYYIEREFEEERQREWTLRREGKVTSVSQCEDTTAADADETLSPVKKRSHSQRETLVEQEIRLQREREEQYRSEKGLTSPTSPRLTAGGAVGGTPGVTDGGEKERGIANEVANEVANSPAESSEAAKSKYRPQRRSLVLAQQWEQMFK